MIRRKPITTINRFFYHIIALLSLKQFEGVVFPTIPNAFGGDNRTKVSAVGWGFRFCTCILLNTNAP
jgi:hypothetical protein